MPRGRAARMTPTIHRTKLALVFEKICIYKNWYAFWFLKKMRKQSLGPRYSIPLLVSSVHFIRRHHKKFFMEGRKFFPT